MDELLTKQRAYDQALVAFAATGDRLEPAGGTRRFVFGSVWRQP